MADSLGPRGVYVAFPVHGIFQAKILEWVAFFSSSRSSQRRDYTRVSCIFCIGRWVLYHWATWEAHLVDTSPYKQKRLHGVIQGETKRDHYEMVTSINPYMKRTELTVMQAHNNSLYYSKAKCIHPHSNSIAHNSQKAEATQESTSRQMDG